MSGGFCIYALHTKTKSTPTFEDMAKALSSSGDGYTICVRNGVSYAVFASGLDLIHFEINHDCFDGCRVTNFGEFENAFVLGTVH